MWQNTYLLNFKHKFHCHNKNALWKKDTKHLQTNSVPRHVKLKSACIQQFHLYLEEPSSNLN